MHCHISLTYVFMNTLNTVVYTIHIKHIWFQFRSADCHQSHNEQMKQFDNYMLDMWLAAAVGAKVGQHPPPFHK